MVFGWASWAVAQGPWSSGHSVGQTVGARCGHPIAAGVIPVHAHGAWAMPPPSALAEPQDEDRQEFAPLDQAGDLDPFLRRVEPAAAHAESVDGRQARGLEVVAVADPARLAEGQLLAQ